MSEDREVKIACKGISKTFHVPGQKKLLHVLNAVSPVSYTHLNGSCGSGVGNSGDNGVGLLDLNLVVFAV